MLKAPKTLRRWTVLQSVWPRQEWNEGIADQGNQEWQISDVRQIFLPFKPPEGLLFDEDLAMILDCDEQMQV